MFPFIFNLHLFSKTKAERYWLQRRKKSINLALLLNLLSIIVFLTIYVFHCVYVCVPDKGQDCTPC